MIEIDGSKKSGSGTILRMAVALAVILGTSLHVFNIRKNRPQPGLRHQHLAAVLTAAQLCNAELEGAALNSPELLFKPGKIKGGYIKVKIGTAGSIPLLMMTVLPICIFAEKTVNLTVSQGGTDVPHSPTINFLRYVFFPVLHRMGISTQLKIQKYGYYPKGGGEVTIKIEPCGSLKSLHMEKFGAVQSVSGISVCTSLAERKVAWRQAQSAENYLAQRGYPADISVINDTSNPVQKGSSLVIWAKTDTGAILGADAIGKIGKTSEIVGTEAAKKLYSELSEKSTADSHLADMLVPYAALAQNSSTFLTRTISTHLETNIWLIERILNVTFNVEKVNRLYKIEKVG